MKLSIHLPRWCAAVLAAGVVTVTVTVAIFWGQGAAVSEGRDTGSLAGQKPEPSSVEAYFTAASYRPGAHATLVIRTRASSMRLRMFRIGSVPIDGIRRDELRGVPVTDSARLTVGRSRRASGGVDNRIGDWPSGVYYAELHRPGGELGYAPFIVRPRRLGEHAVAVVMPTYTWQAYNRRDADGNARGDTWYADTHVHTVDLTRAFLDRGVPPHFHRYDLPFLHWLATSGKDVDYLSDRDLDLVASGDTLARAYTLIAFPGHHEYVTAHEYDVITRYRNLGGNLMFLSANNFFWRVERHGAAITRTQQWRDLGRPESALIGVQYIGNDGGQHQGPYRVRDTPAGRWIFAGTGLQAGSKLGHFGIEIDATTPTSPPGTRVLAEIKDLLAPGKTAQMSYYETSRGARVFATGAFTLAGQTRNSQVAQILENLWRHLAEDDQPPLNSQPDTGNQ